MECFEIGDHLDEVRLRELPEQIVKGLAILIV